MKEQKICAVILAAGKGRRMCSEKTKQTMELVGKSILKRSVEAFADCPYITDVTVVAKEDELDYMLKETQSIDKVKNVVIGGKSRAESAKLGFESLDADTDYVLIHDAARCLITIKEICDVLDAAIKYGAASASIQVTDTLKRCDSEAFVLETVSRDNLYSVATPQAFSYAIYKNALANAERIDDSITDDNMLVEKSGVSVKCVATLATNLKITTSDDLELAEFILRKRENLI